MIVFSIQLETRRTIRFGSDSMGISDITEAIDEFLKPIDTWINDVLDVNMWYIAFVFIIVAAFLFIWKFKAVQITTLREQLRLIKPSKVDRDMEKKGVISSFQAFCVGLGARVGVGNITGVTSAIIMGGAGAVFWMWIFALLGAGTSFVECTIAQLFKEKKSDGNYHGGPAYYIMKGLKSRKFALFIAFWIILTYGVGFVANQAANSASAFTKMPELAGIEGITIILAVVFAILTGLLVFGGIKRIAKFSSSFVPIMVVIWLIIGVIAIIININQFAWACGEIVGSAFAFDKIFAGLAGSCIMWGLRRGVFSNEAGIGSVPNVAAQSDVQHPVRQGLIQSTGVLIDTLVVCSITAFMVLTCIPSGTWGGIWADAGRSTNEAMNIVQTAMSNAFGGDWILWVLAVFMFIFAFTSLIAYYSMSEANLRFIKDSPKALFGLRSMIVIIVFAACIVPVSLVWDLMDVFMAVMGIMNIFALFFLFKYAHAAFMDYKKQKRAGIVDPVFDVDNWDAPGLDKSGITAWKRS